MRTTVHALLSLTVLAACSTVPGERALREADYGRQPDGAYREAIRAAFADLLLDPGSARFEYGSPERGWGSDENGFVFGWVVWTQINSKNQFGAYTGWKTYKVLTVDGRVHSIYEPQADDAFGNPRFRRLE